MVTAAAFRMAGTEPLLSVPNPQNGDGDRGTRLLSLQVALGFFRVMATDAVVAEEVHRALGQGDVFRAGGGCAWPSEAQAEQEGERLGQAKG